MGFIGNMLDLAGMGEAKKLVDSLTVQVGTLIESLKSMKAFMSTEESYPTVNRSSLEKLGKIYRDETARNAVDFLTYVVMQKIGVNGYHHDDPKIVELVNKAIENMEGSFYSHCRDLLGKGLFFGFSAMQLIFNVVDNEFLFDWMVNYNSEDLSFKVAKNERNKEFISHIKKESEEFSARNFAIFQYGDLSCVYGYGRGNYISKYYDIKMLNLKLWPIFIQKFTIPTILVKTLGDIDAFLQRVSKWLFNNIIGLVKDQEEIEIIERKAGIDASKIYESCIEFCNKVIFRAFFLLSLMASGEKGGSYALGDIHFQLLMQAAEEIAKDFTDNVLISQIVVKLIDANYGSQKSYGEFRPTKTFTLEDKQKLSEIFFRLANTGVIDPVQDAEWIRKDFEFPELKEGVSVENILQKKNSNEKSEEKPEEIPEEIEDEEDVEVNDEEKVPVAA